MTTGTARPLTRRLAMLLLLAAPLASCSVVPGASVPPPQLYVLSPKSTFPPDMPRTDWQIAIEVPVADAALNTARITVRHDPLSLEYFERANWIDTAPRMLQTLMVESFENSKKAPAVGRASVGLRADYTLVSELRAFQAEYDDGAIATVRIRMDVKLIKMPQRSIVGTVSVMRTARAHGTSIDNVVLAFDDALGKALRKIVAWTLTTLPPSTGKAETR
jgi:cholesterol transport system auxiliary component